jgi:hypothetical protein
MKTKHNTYFGEITIIAREFGVSSVTVNLSLSGKLNTENGILIRKYADYIKNQRVERLEYLKKLRGDAVINKTAVKPNRKTKVDR